MPASILLLCAAAAFAQAPFSLQKETALGEQMAGEVRKQVSVILDPAIRGYVSNLATKLAGPSLLLTVEVIDSDAGATHEPLCLPDGYLFVSGSLIRAAADESEFAAMLAHALAHEIGRDRFRLTQTLSGHVRSRPLELQADVEAVRRSAHAGYDPAALLRYISRVSPDDAERIDALTAAITELGSEPEATLDSSDFQRIQEKLVPSRATTPPTLTR